MIDKWVLGGCNTIESSFHYFLLVNRISESIFKSQIRNIHDLEGMRIHDGKKVGFLFTSELWGVLSTALQKKKSFNISPSSNLLAFPRMYP